MIDLKSMYGDTYKITLDESGKIPGQSREDRLWNYRIPCKFGHIYVHSADMLGAFTDRRGVRSRLRSIPGVRVHQVGDVELSVVFPPSIFPQVAEVLHPRRRPSYTDEQRRAMADRMAALRSRSRENGGQAAQGEADLAGVVSGIDPSVSIAPGASQDVA